MQPLKLTDARFRWTPAAKTDIRKTFDLARPLWRLSLAERKIRRDCCERTR